MSKLFMEHKESPGEPLGDFLRRMVKDSTPDPSIAENFHEGDIVYGSLGGYSYICEVADVQVSSQGFVFIIPLSGTVFRIGGRNVSLGMTMGYELQEALSIRNFPAKQMKVLGTVYFPREGITKDEKILLGQFNSFGV